MPASAPPEGFRQHRFVPPPGSTTVLLVRHGESAPAHPDRPFPTRDGHGDPPLHPVGREQAARVARRLAAEHAAGDRIAAIYVSTLVRTVETAAPLAAAVGLEPRVEPDLREVHLGEWEGGLLRVRAAAGDPVFREMLTAERWDVIPGAEPHERFRARVGRALERIAHAHPGERVVAVAHGGVIGRLASDATGSRDFAFNGADNASITEIVVGAGRWVLRRYNDTSHLAGL